MFILAQFICLDTNCICLINTTDTSCQFKEETAVNVSPAGYVNVTVALHGISKNNKYIAVHFPGFGKDPEVIPCYWEEGIITLTLGTEFSPVMILSYETRKADPDTSIQGNSKQSVSDFLPVLLVPCIYLFLRKKSSE